MSVPVFSKETVCGHAFADLNIRAKYPKTLILLLFVEMHSSYINIRTRPVLPFSITLISLCPID